MNKFIKTAEQNAEISKKNASLVAQWKRNGIPQSAMLTPEIDKDNWGIIHNSIIGLPFQIPYSCANTIESHCQPYANVSSVTECKNICKADPLCQVGNFITMDDKTYCIPYSHTSNISSNMADSIWNLYSNYQNKHIKSSSFLNYNLYSPWNSLDYSLFFGDKLSIMVDNETGGNFNKNLPSQKQYDQQTPNQLAEQYIGIGNNLNDKNFAKAVNTKISLQLVAPGALTDNSGEIKIKNYYNVMINVYGTYLVLQQQLITKNNEDIRCSGDNQQILRSDECKDKYQYTDRIEWFNGLGSLQNNANQFTLICLDKQPNDQIDYDDKFVFITDNQYLCIDDQNNIFVKPYDFLQKHKNYKYLFKFNPEFTVSYCNNKSNVNIKELAKHDKPDNNVWAKKFRCEKTSIDKCIRQDNDFFYIVSDDKFPVYRGQWCYGICRDDGSVQYTNRIPLLTDKAERNIIIDQLIISISIVLVSYFLFMLLK